MDDLIPIGSKKKAVISFDDADDLIPLGIKKQNSSSGFDDFDDDFDHLLSASSKKSKKKGMNILY